MHSRQVLQSANYSNSILHRIENLEPISRSSLEHFPLAGAHVVHNDSRGLLCASLEVLELHPLLWIYDLHMSDDFIQAVVGLTRESFCPSRCAWWII
jgi:hypothetical protein